MHISVAVRTVRTRPLPPKQTKSALHKGWSFGCSQCIHKIKFHVTTRASRSEEVQTHSKMHCLGGGSCTPALVFRSCACTKQDLS